MDVDPFSVESARAAHGSDALAEWVRDFLASPGSDNAALGEQLATTNQWWVGPIELPLDRLHRLAGPPGAPVLEVVDDDEWRDDVDDLADDVEDGHALPPVVVTFRGDQLVLEDGNHRVEALRRAGCNTAWGVVGFEEQDEVARFQASIADASRDR